MKPNLPPVRRVSALLFSAAVLVSTPALAQDAVAPQVAPPAAEAPPPAVDVAPPVVVTTAPAPQTPVVTMAPPNPVVQQVPEAPVEAQAPATTRSTRTVRADTRTTQAATRTAAPVTQPAAPASAAPATVVPETPAVTPATPVDPVVPAATTETTTTQSASTSNMLAWAAGIAIALVALGLLLFAMRRRNTSQHEVVETTRQPMRAAVAPEPLVSPVIVPVAAEPMLFETEAREQAVRRELNGRAPHVAPHVAESAVHDANADDLAGITDAEAPVARRPWLEFGIRPLRAGTSYKEALVEVELIVGNAGDTAAEDVRISTFMLPAGSASEMDHLLTEHLSDASAPPVDIAPGEGTCVDAILSVSRDELNGDKSFSPVVVAEARYKLPDGSEGRTAAAFKVGVTDEDGDRFDPISLERAEIFHTVAAQLHGTPEHV